MKSFRRFAVLLFCLGLGPVWGQDARQQALLEAVRANPKDANAHFNLGVSYFNQQDYKRAAESFKKCVGLNSKDDQARELLESSLGISDYRERKYASAADHFRKTLRINPKNPNANLLLGDSYLQLNQHAKAEEAMKTYAAAFPADRSVQAKAHEGLGKLYLSQGKFEAAIVSLEKVAAADPKNHSAHQNLGYANFQMKDYKAAAQAWEKAARLEKDSQTYKFLGFSYYNLGDFDNAIANYKRSIRMEEAEAPKDRDAKSLGETHYNLAVAYNDNALFDEAADSFASAFQLNPKDSNAAVGKAQAIEAATTSHMEKASDYLLSNRYSDAIREWRKVLEYQPNNSQAKNFIADAQSKLAEEVERLYASGRSHAAKGRTMEALNDWNQALQMDPGNKKIQQAARNLEVKKLDRVKSLVAEGDAQAAAGDYEGALRSYQMAKKADPGSSLAEARLKKVSVKRTSELDRVYDSAMAAYSKGRLQEAQRLILSARDMAPGDPKVSQAVFKIRKDITVKVKSLNESGTSLFESGKREQARAKFEEVLKLKPTDETANGYIKRLTGQQSVQKADAEKVKTLYYEGVNLYINGKIQDAIKQWEQCLQLDPGNTNAKKNIEKAQAKLESIKRLSKN